MRNGFLRALPALIVGLGFQPWVSHACTVTLASSGAVYQTLQSALYAAGLNDSVTINGASGACVENVQVPNTLIKLIITGVNNATVSGASLTAPTIDSRGKSVAIYTTTITGGSRGLVIQRNTNAFLQGITVKNAAKEGIAVNSMAFAVILGSTIESNGGAGIAVYSSAAARIGLNFFEDTGPAYNGNTIQFNAHEGIFVAALGHAFVYANTISGNSRDGIFVLGGGAVNTGGNTINGNSRSGIEADLLSGVFLGTDPSDLKTPYPDQTTAPNGQYGLKCSFGSAFVGHLGSSNPVTGSGGQFSFDSSCANGTSGLVTP